MATGGVRVHPTDDMGARAFGAGGPSMSRHSASEMYQDISSKTVKTFTLEEAYWTDRRRKMGLTRRHRHEPVQDDDYQKMREEQIQFVKSHFHQKECRLFIPVSGQCGNGKKCKVKDLKCHCGEVLSMHDGMRRNSKESQFENCFLIPQEYASVFRDPDRLLTEELPPPLTKWTPEECFNTGSSKAFGKIDFNVEQIGGKKPVKYVRLCGEDSVDDCFKLMEEYWHIMDPEPPHLVISVVGGAKNFKLDGQMRETFSNGLIKAAKTTKAWMITSGFNMGVMKAVGQAVHEGQTFQWDNDRMTHVLRCIGIAPWGYVKGRQYLESNGSGCFNAYYRTSTQILHKQPVPLNPDHTHFIFVDDGYRIRYGGVAQFRSKFERKIALDKKDGGLGIPVVLLLVEGGTDAIEDVSASLAQGIPVVVCAGTGRAADILTYAYNHMTSTQDKKRALLENHKEKLKSKIQSAYMKQGKELDALTEKVIKCCEKAELLTIFYINKHEELDLAILSVLLKVETDSSRENQLKLALTWNRADIAQEEIFREDIIWREGSLESFLTQALVEDKVEFVKLLLNNGIIMQEYLTIDRLEFLYNSIPGHSYLFLILKAYCKKKDERFTIADIGNFLRQLLDRYDDDTFTKGAEDEKRRSSGFSLFPSRSKTQSSFANKKMSLRQVNSDLNLNCREQPNRFKRPYKQLLIWAVLMNRFQLAQLFWEMGDEPITSALVCSSLCLGMEFKVPKYLSIIRNSFHEMKDQFEQLAISVLDECHNTTPDKAIMLVERKSPTWSGLTCLQIAASASDQAFVSSVGCQNSINNVWKSGILSSWPKVFLSAVCPLMILTSLEISLMGKQVMSNTQKLLTFYAAPLTKFSIYSAVYAGFLILFTYMLLVDYDEKPSASEYIVMIWILSYLVGGIHSFAVFPSPTFSGKMRDYFGLLDRLDFFNLILFLIGFVVRWYYLFDAKIIYCINAVIFYIRVMKLYTANRSLGPKIYMINRMVGELAMFVMVLMVFLLAYGVASQGLLYKHRGTNWSIMKDVLYFPYWQLYGEIYLEELDTDETCVENLSTAMNGTVPDNLNDCRTYHWLVPILLALYLLIGNVLLLNLLIAIFSHVFDTVEQNAIEIWKFQMYFLVMEFQNKPILPPPLSIISYIFYIVRFVFRKVCRRGIVKSKQFLQHHLEFLSLFEKEMMANKLRAKKANIMHSVEMKLHILQTRMDELTRIIEDEVIAEQYNMMPTADFMYMRAQTTTNQMDKKSPVEEAVTEDSKKKHKHKKSKKKRDRSKEKEPPVDEEKQLNINIPEEEKKTVQDKVQFVSDDENGASDNRRSRSLPPLRAPSPRSPLALRSPKIAIHALPDSKRGPSIGSHSAAAVQEERNPNMSVSFNFPGHLAEGDAFDLHEEPLQLYSPRRTHLSNMAFEGNTRSSLLDENMLDISSGSEVSFRQAMERRTRRHLARRRDEDGLQSRIERASRNDLTNNFSSKRP